MVAAYGRAGATNARQLEVAGGGMDGTIRPDGITIDSNFRHTAMNLARHGKLDSPRNRTFPVTATSKEFLHHR